MADVSDLEQAKKEIRAILTSRSGNCMSMRELSNDYKSMIGNEIPFASLGFSTLTSFLRTLKDTVHVETATFPRGSIVYLVRSDNSAHIQELVNHQQKSRKTSSKRPNVQPFQMRSNNFNQRPNGLLPTPPHFPLPFFNAMENYIPCANYPPQAYHSQRQPLMLQQQQQQRPVLLPQVQSGPSVNLLTMLKLHQHMRTIVQNNLLLQQQIHFEQILNAQRFAANPQNTPNRFAQPWANVERKGSNSSIEVAAPPIRPETREPVSTASDSQQQESPRIQTVHGKLPIHSESSTSNSERNLSGFSNISRDASSVSAALSENKLSSISWANDIVEDIDHISITDIEPMFSFTVVALNIRYPAAKLPSNLEKNIIGQLELVAVCELINPTKFWIHLTSQYDELTKILSRLEEIYSKSASLELRLKDIDIQRGHLCAVLFKNVWHRGEILSDPDRFRYVKVSLVDYGPTITTQTSNIRALTNDLAAYPIQAFAAYLTNVEPVLGEIWEAECTHKMVEMVSEAFLYARIVELKSGPVLGIELIDTSNEDDVIINTKLVELGFAKRI